MLEPDNQFLNATFFEATVEVKKSQFIAALAHVNSREQALEVISGARQRYPDARHHCWAYVIKSGTSAAMSDDGEPSGTAGKPILSVIQHKGISEIVVVISRYFGGVKLGAGGLVRAYSGATQNVIDQIQLVEPIVQVEFDAQCDFSQEQSLRHWLNQHNGELLSIDYTNQVRVKIKLPEVNQTAFLLQLDALGITYKQL